MKEKVAFFSILVNVLLTLGKIIGGILSYSSILLAEGFHSLVDIVSSLISYWGLRIAQKPEDQKHPYGHYKFEVLAGFLIALILFSAGMGVLFESYEKIRQPSFIRLPFLAISVLFASSLINTLMAFWKVSVGKKENSLALISDGIHSRADTVASFAALGGIILNRYWPLVDPLFAALIGFYIIKEAFSLAKEAVDSLLDAAAPLEIETKIKEIVARQNIELLSLKTQKKGSVLTANLEISLPKNLSVEEATQISSQLKDSLVQEINNLVYVAIQIKSHDTDFNFYKPQLGMGRPFSWQRRGRFKAQNEEAQAKGPEGYCVCPSCGYKVPHQRGIPCSQMFCPQCQIPLKREEIIKNNN